MIMNGRTIPAELLASSSMDSRMANEGQPSRGGSLTARSTRDGTDAYAERRVGQKLHENDSPRRLTASLAATPRATGKVPYQTGDLRRTISRQRNVNDVGSYGRIPRASTAASASSAGRSRLASDSPQKTVPRSIGPAQSPRPGHYASSEVPTTSQYASRYSGSIRHTTYAQRMYGYDGVTTCSGLPDPPQVVRQFLEVADPAAYNVAIQSETGWCALATSSRCWLWKSDEPSGSGRSASTSSVVWTEDTAPAQIVFSASSTDLRAVPAVLLLQASGDVYYWEDVTLSFALDRARHAKVDWDGHECPVTLMATSNTTFALMTSHARVMSIVASRRGADLQTRTLPTSRNMLSSLTSYFRPGPASSRLAKPRPDTRLVIFRGQVSVAENRHTLYILDGFTLRSWRCSASKDEILDTVDLSDLLGDISGEASRVVAGASLSSDKIVLALTQKCDPTLQFVILRVGRDKSATDWPAAVERLAMPHLPYDLITSSAAKFTITSVDFDTNLAVFASDKAVVVFAIHVASKRRPYVFATALLSTGPKSLIKGLASSITASANRILLMTASGQMIAISTPQALLAHSGPEESSEVEHTRLFKASLQQACFFATVENNPLSFPVLYLPDANVDYVARTVIEEIESSASIFETHALEISPQLQARLQALDKLAEVLREKPYVQRLSLSTVQTFFDMRQLLEAAIALWAQRNSRDANLRLVGHDILKEAFVQHCDKYNLVEIRDDLKNLFKYQLHVLPSILSSFPPLLTGTEQELPAKILESAQIMVVAARASLQSTSTGLEDQCPGVSCWISQVDFIGSLRDIIERLSDMLNESDPTAKGQSIAPPPRVPQTKLMRLTLSELLSLFLAANQQRHSAMEESDLTLCWDLAVAVWSRHRLTDEAYAAAEQWNRLDALATITTIQPDAQRVSKYMAVYGEQYARAYADSLLAHEHYSNLLEFGQFYPAALSSYLSDRDDLDELNALHAIFSKDYDSASTLLQKAAQSEQETFAKKVFLSLAQLTAYVWDERRVAKAGMPVSQLTGLRAIYLREEVFAHFNSQASVGGDNQYQGQAETISEANIYAGTACPAIRDQFHGLCEILCSKGYMADRDLVVLLSLTKNDYYVTHWLDAAQLCLSMEDTKLKVALLSCLWRRLYLRTDWSSYISFDQMPESQVTTRLLSTDLGQVCRRISLGDFSEDIYQSPSTTVLHEPGTENLALSTVDAHLQPELGHELARESSQVEEYIKTAFLEERYTEIRRLVR